MLADDKEIITKYKEQIAAFRVTRIRGCVILNARIAPKYLQSFHSEIREIQKCGFHIQQLRPLLLSALSLSANISGRSAIELFVCR